MHQWKVDRLFVLVFIRMEKSEFHNTRFHRMGEKIFDVLHVSGGAEIAEQENDCGCMHARHVRPAILWIILQCVALKMTKACEL